MAFGMGPRGKIREERREKRRDKRRSKRADARNKHFLGGSRKEEEKLWSDAKERTDSSRKRTDEAFGRTGEELDNARDLQGKAGREYGSDRRAAQNALGRADSAVDGIGTATSGSDATLTQAQGSAAGIRSNALAYNPLTQTTESTIAANTANANAQAAYQQQQIANQARGLAASGGAGSALALQQAIASSGAANQAIAAQSNLALAEQNAALRQSAAEYERQAALGFAGQNAADAMATGAARAELGYTSAVQQQAARAALAQQAQAQSQLASNRELNFQGQRSNIAQNQATTAAGIEGQDKEYQLGLATAKYNAQQGRGNKTNWFQKIISTTSDPMDLRGSGERGII